MLHIKRATAIVYAVEGLQQRGAVNDDPFVLYNMINWQ